jgi:signal transduction histidine kinase
VGDIERDAVIARPWREEALRKLLSMAAVAGPFIAIVGTILSRERRPTLLLVTIWVCAAVIVVLRLQRRLPFRLAASISIAALYVPALVAAFYYGLNPGAGVVTTGAIVLAAIYFGRWPAYLLLAPALLEYLVIGWFFTRGVLTVPRISEVNSAAFSDWIRIISTYGMMTGFLATAVHYLVNRLERHYSAAVTAGALLQDAEARWQRCGEELIDLGRSETIESGRLRSAFREICEAAARALAVERCSVWLLDEPGHALRCMNLFELTPARHSSGMQFPAALCPAYFAALEEERTLAVQDAHSDPRTRELVDSYLLPHGISSMLDAPIRHRDRLVGVVCHEHVGAPMAWPLEAQSFAGSMADFAARALAAAERAAKDRGLRTAYQQLSQLNRRLESAKEEERRHIAHELHDELGQTLTALKLRFQMLARQSDDAAEVAHHTGEALTLVNGLIDRVRQLSLDLRPPLLDEVGLGPALRAHLDTRASESGIGINLDARGLDGHLSPEIEMAAYRLVQEAVTNVLRHAAARTIAVSLARAPRSLAISVRDDGRGFGPEDGLDRVERAAAEGHFGLLGMRERARALGGEFTITSTPGKGTTVDVQLPIG